MIGPGFVSAALGDWFRKLVPYILVACLLIGLGAGSVWYAVAGRLARKDAQIEALSEVLDQAAKQRKADQATLARLAQKNAAAARESASLRRELDAALAASPDWAAQPVPQVVQDALQGQEKAE